MGETSTDHHRRNSSETGGRGLGSTYRRKQLGAERRSVSWWSYPDTGVGVWWSEA
jgi:hypothetical protein